MMKKTFCLVLIALIGVPAIAKINEVNLAGKIVAFDQKTVTVKVADRKLVLDRSRLGPEFTSMIVGDTVWLEIKGEAPPRSPSSKK